MTVNNGNNNYMSKQGLIVLGIVHSNIKIVIIYSTSCFSTFEFLFFFWLNR